MCANRQTSLKDRVKIVSLTPKCDCVSYMKILDQLLLPAIILIAAFSYLSLISVVVMT